ncbi:MAG: phospholipase [Chitinophagaceae bacterium]|nr:MAG: phospholipase [Chitinophagaceae bacterium]
MSPGKQKSKLVYVPAWDVRIVRGGKEFFGLALEMIRRATSVIHLQTYILECDSTGRLITAALSDAVKRGVFVYLLADGYASRSLPVSFVNELRAAGINFGFFAPLFKSGSLYVGRRLHHKLLVIDIAEVLTGGINISDRYNELPHQPAWLDFALYAKGTVAGELYTLCCKTWNNFRDGVDFPAARQMHSPEPSGVQSMVAVCRNDWVRRKNDVSSTYVRMLRSSASEVIIICSYFIPGRILRQQLAAASKRGVRIRVITAGISDVGIAKQAERYAYSFLLENGIEIYEYCRTVLHGKMAVSDDQWMTIGSYNLNNISTYASIELNINVDDPRIARNTAGYLRQLIMDDCNPVTCVGFHGSGGIAGKFIRWISYVMVRIIIYLFTFYYKHHH